MVRTVGASLALLLLCTAQAVAAYTTYAPGQSIVLGDFVYDDDYTATTTNCTISIWGPSGSSEVSNAAMTAANSFYNYTYSSTTEGTFPAQMTCGYAGDGSLVKQDKTFIIASSSASAGATAEEVAELVNENTNSIVTAASSSLGTSLSSIISTLASIPASIWSYSARTLTTFGTLAADVWSSATRTLTGASLSSGSLATQSDVQSASTSVAAVVNANTDSRVATASSSIAAVVNANTGTQTASLSSTIGSASTSVAAVINANTNSIVTTASSSLGLVLGSAITSVASSITGIPADVWAYTGRTLTSFGSLAADVWSSGTRTLTGASLSSGSLATQSDVQTASSSVVAVVNANTNTQTSGISSDVNAHTDTALATASSSIAAVVNANTDSEVATASSSVASVVNSNTNAIVLAASSSLGSTLATIVSSVADMPSLVWSSGTRTLTAFGTLAADVWSSGTRTLTGASLSSGSLATQSDVQSASSSVAAVVNANTDSRVASASSSIASVVNANTDTETAALSSTLTSASTSIASVVNANTNSIVATASSSLVSVLGSAISSVAASITGIPADVWSYTGRTLTSFGTLAADVWSSATRTLTGASLSSGSLATQSDVQSASTSVAAVVNANTTSVVTSASSSLGSAISNISAASSGWLVQMSDFDSVLAGEVYRARVTVLYGSTLTAPNSAPSITVYDADRNVVASGISMTLLSTGVYEYTYTVSSSGAEGTWESVVSTAVESGKTVQTNDYWSVVSAPAQVLIQSMGSTETPSVSANIRISNEGSVNYEYQYEWCVVSTISNACGGGNDTYYASAAKLIDAGDDFDTTLTATVPLAGTYYFKTVAYFGADSSVASRQFTATAPSSSGGGSGNSGGGGGGGGGRSSAVPASAAVAQSATPADINGDNKVNGTDFSILLAFWKGAPPANNPGVDLNRDNKIDSIDFSILLYRWSK